MKKRLLIILSVLALLLVLLTTIAAAAGGSAVCDTFAEFKTAMENPSVETVTLTGFVENISGSGDAITVESSSGVKKLVLNGTASLTQPSKNSGYENLIYVESGVKLSVSGNGSLQWTPTLNSGSNALFYLDGGTLHFTDTFTGSCESVDNFAGVYGPIVYVNKGHLLSENGYFRGNDNDVSTERGVIETFSADNTIVTLLGGHYSYAGTEGGSYVVLDNCDDLMIQNITYATGNGLGSNMNYEVPVDDHENYVTWNPFNSAKELNFPMVDLNEPAYLSFTVTHSQFQHNDMLYRFLKSVEIKEKTGNTWTTIDTFEGTTDIYKTLDACSEPTVKTYKIVFNYEYEYGGETTEFTLERESRAEWKDFSYDGDGTEANPVRVSTFAELRRALYDSNVEYVEVTADIEEELNYNSYNWGGADPYSWEMKYRQGKVTAEEFYQHLASLDVTDTLVFHRNYLGDHNLNMCALTTSGNKHLILSHDVTLSVDSFPYSADDSGFKRGIQMTDDLTISGGGTFIVTLTAPNMGADAAAIMNEMGDTLTIEDATIIAKSAQAAGYAHAIMSTSGRLIINGGEFRGQRLNNGKPYTNDNTSVGAVYVGSDSSAEINGGTFTEVELGEDGTQQIAGLMLDGGALNSVTLNGGTFVTGIMYEGNTGVELLGSADMYDIMKIGATYETQAKSVGGVDYTTYTVTPSTVNIPEGYGQDPDHPVMCYSFAEFKYAMESSEIQYVALGNVNDMMTKIPNPDGSEGFEALAAKHGVKSKTQVQNWVAVYRAFGAEGLAVKTGRAVYSAAFKRQVLDYMRESGSSLTGTALRFGINNPATVAQWSAAFRKGGTPALEGKRRR